MHNREKAYDYRLKADALNGIIPEQFKEIIKPYHICRWKREGFKRVIGFNYYNNREVDLQILNKEIKTLSNELNTLSAERSFLGAVINEISNNREYNFLLRKHRKEIIKEVESKREILGIKNCCKLLKIDSSTYTIWKQGLRDKCFKAFDLICIKRHEKELSKDEELAMIALLRDARYEHFPLTALLWMARHENIVYASMNTWRKIKKKHNIIRVPPKRERKKFYSPLKSKYVNQYLHADITHFKLSNNKTYYIYVIKDNYSKYIKSCEIFEAINSEFRVRTFENALMDIDTKSCREIRFITDRGTENKNAKVTEFFKQFENIHIKYARADIPYSNSMVERYNHDLKYMYLYRKKIRTLGQLKKIVGFAVYEHNHVKRLNCLNGQTPYEVYFNMPLKNTVIKKKWNEAREKRKLNKTTIVCCIDEKI